LCLSGDLFSVLTLNLNPARDKMYITVDKAKRNLRIGISNLIQKQKVGNRSPSDCVGVSRQGICTMLVVLIAYLTHSQRTPLYNKDLQKHVSDCSRPCSRSKKLTVHRERGINVKVLIINRL
jgi:hypothetical protein